MFSPHVQWRDLAEKDGRFELFDSRSENALVIPQAGLHPAARAVHVCTLALTGLLGCSGCAETRSRSGLSCALGFLATEAAHPYLLKGFGQPPGLLSSQRPSQHTWWHAWLLQGCRHTLRHIVAALGAVPRREIPDQVICSSCAWVGPRQVASRACMQASGVIADAVQTGTDLPCRCQSAAVASKTVATVSNPPCKAAAERQAYAGAPACATRGLRLQVLAAIAHLLVSMYDCLKL